MTSNPGVPEGDIRWQFDLSGGSLMDMSYALEATNPRRSNPIRRGTTIRQRQPC
ncbi:hypothetical protein VTN96DRAFT_4014 [Rasamsonia emersonii]